MPRILPYTRSDKDWVVDRHGALYAREEGFDADFPALVNQILTDFDAALPSHTHQGWIAWDNGNRLGSVFVVPEEPGTAKLRLFLVEPAARGTGLAQRLLDQAMDFARATGASKLRLWTHESHLAAGKIYARNGFHIVDSWPNRFCGQDVIAQIWERKL